ncbi:single-stranded-DNA-specific exonuclease RecJ, partial [Pseudomonas aeruginosa]
TDHHLPGPELPAADGIINPNQPGCEFPSKAMAGVGVFFYVMLALRARLRELDRFARRGLKEPNHPEQLHLVALGSVADVVPL